MPEKETMQKARDDARKGKSASTQAGEFVREEMHHIREGKHGARSTKQAIAIGLSKARRAGVKLAPPGKGKASARTRDQARRDASKGRGSARKRPSPTRSRAIQRALKREGHQAASPKRWRTRLAGAPARVARRLGDSRQRRQFERSAPRGCRAPHAKLPAHVPAINDSRKWRKKMQTPSRIERDTKHNSSAGC